MVCLSTHPCCWGNCVAKNNKIAIYPKNNTRGGELALASTTAARGSAAQVSHAAGRHHGRQELDHCKVNQRLLRVIVRAQRGLLGGTRSLQVKAQEHEHGGKAEAERQRVLHAALHLQNLLHLYARSVTYTRSHTSGG